MGTGWTWHDLSCTKDGNEVLDILFHVTRTFCYTLHKGPFPQICTMCQGGGQLKMIFFVYENMIKNVYFPISYWPNDIIFTFEYHIHPLCKVLASIQYFGCPPPWRKLENMLINPKLTSNIIKLCKLLIVIITKTTKTHIKSIFNINFWR